MKADTDSKQPAHHKQITGLAVLRNNRDHKNYLENLIMKTNLGV